jgi:allophanate hydrolase subunit 1
VKGPSERIRAIVDEIETRPPPGLVEYVPAFTTILLEFDPKLMPNPAQIAPNCWNSLNVQRAFHLSER